MMEIPSKSKRYWTIRQLKHEHELRKDASEFIEEAQKTYNEAMFKLEQDIATRLVRIADDNGISVTEAMRRLDKKELIGWEMRLNEFIELAEQKGLSKEMELSLRNASSRVHLTHLQEMKNLIDLQMTLHYTGLEKDVKKFLGAEWDKIITQATEDGISKVATGYNQKALQTVLSKPWAADGKTFSKRIWEDGQKVSRQLQNNLEQSILIGKNPKDIIKDIECTTGAKESDIARLVYTEHAYVASEADSFTWKDMGLEKYEISAVIDAKTSEICREMDGKVFDMKNRRVGVTAPPFHPYCRTVTIPWFEDMDDDDVPDNMTDQERKDSMVEGHTEDLKPVVPDGKVESKKVNAEPSMTRQSLELANVEYREVQPLEKELSVQEIIDRVGGGDMTKGSCSSLAFAYAGNRNGLNVLDFRGGKSLSIFACKGNVKEITELAGGKIVSNFNDYKAVNELLKSVVEGKEYYLATGKHAAIVRMIEGHYEYLELQSATDNGWFRLTNGVLKKRFGCQKSHSVHGFKLEAANVLIDIESLNRLDEFEILLGYINTAVESQMKGSDGHIK